MTSSLHIQATSTGIEPKSLPSRLEEREAGGENGETQKIIHSHTACSTNNHVAFPIQIKDLTHAFKSTLECNNDIHFSWGLVHCLSRSPMRLPGPQCACPFHRRRLRLVFWQILRIPLWQPVDSKTLSIFKMGCPCPPPAHL